MTMDINAPIVSDPSLADGQLDGYSASGALICSLKYIPVFERLYGTEDDEREVASWHVSPGGIKRIAAVAAWNACQFPRHPTAGNA